MANQTTLRSWSRLASLHTNSTTSPQSQSHKLINSPQPSKLNVSTEIDEHKILVEQEPHKTIEKAINGNGSGPMQKVLNKKHSDCEDSSSNTRVITISGENRGAYMQIIQSRKKPNNMNDKSERVRTLLSSPPRNGLYMNSNVQCVNNSLLLHTCCTHHDLGQHLSLSENPFVRGFHLKERN